MFTPATRHPVQMVDVLWGVAALAVLVGMAWLGYKIEPHWVSKDGERFLCVAQVLDHTGDPLTRWKECRVAIDRGWLRVDQKRRFRRPLTTYWKLEAEGSNPPRRKVVFVGRRRTRRRHRRDHLVPHAVQEPRRAAPPRTAPHRHLTPGQGSRNCPRNFSSAVPT